VWSIQLARDQETATLTRTDDGWTIGETPADSATVANILRELSSLRATGFVADSVAFEGDERREIVALGDSGDTLTVVEILGTDGSFMARAAGSEVIFTLPNSRVDQLVPARGDLAADHSPGDGGD